jgi:glycosyltransferase involved in cell wall biosynthesis
MWQGRSVSVVLPTYNERDSIRQTIEDLLATGVVDEVLVVNNNAAPGTSEEVALTTAREIFEPRQGYGYAMQRGLREARGDAIIVCEPDGTFVARDVYKLLAFADDFDVVYGSRTAPTLIWTGANMGFFLRWGNWAVAKLMEFLFNSTTLTDVGCTMRLINRAALESMESEFSIGGSAFGVEIMLLSLRHRRRIIQIPVNYLPRVGRSSVTGDPWKAVTLGVRMIGLILRQRLRPRLPPAPEAALLQGLRLRD